MPTCIAVASAQMRATGIVGTAAVGGSGRAVVPPPPPASADSCRRRRCVPARAGAQRRAAVVVAAISSEPAAADGRAAEALAEQRLALGSGSIAGIPRKDWLTLQAPARYLGNEWGAAHKPWDSASVRFVLAYPEVYEVGASNLGHIVLYTVLNEAPGLLCDRCYLPAPDMQAVLQRHRLPLFAVESKRPLRQFDTMGLSLAYELSATNMLQMIHLAGLPLTWRERLAADGDGAWDPSTGSLPLVFAGGPTATSNPEPYADFCDFFAFGDGEDCLPEIGRCLQAAKAAGASRREALLRLAREVRGVYVPQFYDVAPGWGGAVFPTEEGVPARVLRRVAAPDPSKQLGLVPYVATVHDRLTIEIRRGCTRGCRFCQPGMLTRPARDVAPDAVVAAVQEGVRKTGYTDFSLLSLSCSDYLALPAVGIELRNRLKDERISLNLPSQRVDRFDENIAHIMGGATAAPSITFAPEAGTQRMRDIINKGLSNEELRRGVVTAFEQGWRAVKLYFMIGLPGETDADVLGIAETVQFLQRECRKLGRGRLRVSITVSNFTPKPHTPFQWHSVSTEEFLRKQALLRAAFRKAPDCKVAYTPPRISAMEDFLGRGDRSLGAVVRRAWELGACNEAWWEGTDAAFAAWDAAIAESGLGWKYRAVAAGEWDVLEAVGDARFRGQGGGGKGRLDRGPLGDARLDAPLPWDHVDTGISRAWLKTDLQRALEAVTVPDCSHTVCSECGVCGDDFGDNVVVPPPPVPAFEGAFVPNSLRAQRVRLRFSKRDDLVFVGHLDLMRMFERAVRRADLPVSQDSSPFHSRPRIAAGLALGLGASSSGEILELLLTRRVPPRDVCAALQAAVPPGMELEVLGEYAPVRKETGKVLTLGAVVAGAEYVAIIAPAEPPSADGEAQPQPPPPPPSAEEWRAWVTALLALDEFKMERKNKTGALKTVDLRPALLRAEVRDSALADAEAQGDALAAAVLRQHLPPAGALPAGAATLRFTGAFGMDERGQSLLTPDLVAHMLGSVAGRPLELLHVHRLRVVTNDEPISEEEALEAEAAAVAAAAAEVVRAAARARAAAAAAAGEGEAEAAEDADVEEEGSAGDGTGAAVAR